MQIRPARPSDRDAVTRFTTDTFVWGDYVGDAFDRWVGGDPDAALLVAVDDDDTAQGLVRASLLSESEGWLQAIRVADGWRRRGVGAALTEAAITWVRDAGARVVRLYVETGNLASDATASKSGFRTAGSWAMAERSVGDASPMPAGNGGIRVPAAEQLQRAHSAEAEPAFMSWESGDLYRESRGLFATAWTWRRLQPEDLAEAARAETLWQARSGWAMAGRRNTALSVGWIETSPDDAYDFCRALVDLAVSAGAERSQVMLPEVLWLTNAARRAGYTLHPGTIYERGV